MQLVFCPLIAFSSVWPPCFNLPRPVTAAPSAAEVIDFGEEQFRHIGGEHALVVLGKNAVVKAAFTELAVQEPKPKPIVTELFAEEPFTADAVKRGEHTGLEQLFGRNAATTFPGVKFVEKRGKLLENGVHPALDRAQRMVGRDALVEIDDGQKVRLGLGFH